MFQQNFKKPLVFLQGLVFKLLIFLVPSQLSKHFWPNWAYIFGIRVDFLSPTIYLTDILISVLLILWLLELIAPPGFGQKTIPIFRFLKKKALVIAGVLVFVFLNIYFSLNAFVALIKWLKILEFFFLSLFIISSRNLKIVSWIVKPMILSAVFFGLLGLVQFIEQKTLGGVFYFVGERTFSSETPGIAKTSFFGKEILRVYSTFPHPNALAGFMAAVFLLVAFLPKRRTFSLSFYFIVCITIALSFSRSVWTAIVLLSPVSLLKLKDGIFFKKVLICLPLLVIFVSIGSLPFLTGANNKLFPFINQSLSQRLEYTRLASRIFFQRPLVGSGLGNFILAANTNDKIEKFSWGLEPVHNIYLLVLSETGIIGLLIFYLLTTVSLRRVLSDGRWFLVFPFLLILITGLTDHYWLTLQQNLLTLSLLVSLSFKKT